MKKTILSFITVISFSLAALAQTKPVITAVIKTPDALCESCKTRIESYLKRYDGIMDLNVNFKKGETKVKYITDRINIEEIKAAISNCGYDADDVPADHDAYLRLPKTCKKFADGGHPKPKGSAPIQQ